MANKHHREPIKHTCPDIDEVIRTSDMLIKECNYMNETLEKLRGSNDELRSWGIEEAERVDNLESDLEYTERKLEQANEEIAELKKQIHELESLETA